MVVEKKETGLAKRQCMKGLGFRTGRDTGSIVKRSIETEQKIDKELNAQSTKQLAAEHKGIMQTINMNMLGRVCCFLSCLGVCVDI